ncbi:UDP-N-acetylmuramoyl-L-alanine--D-glutamate ligase [Flavobacterium sp. NRK F10]|uniref:UDP-N-acetylmuramoylalanine--D-glutamate ligase n=1 Tax=Flavobacterium sediminis TaxID=2201181 RepID=A0A2U8QV97_9FLAO|nr:MULTISPECIES: UDP-N-acetylmuramoyl-L-alanine--D-glutamate ligase [Flavobacterium]AWM14088.1 UDP-N-acetylmuramoyl-L-alanine--D-glutamate ligase [Flavobacterium sediminis]MCO6175284.1 UDP-N-acetylmuramoyl-L-alanine--D-glutamate ligase [Flavobacterium sp. NRK F10]
MRLVVLGGGESGVGTAILGKKKGYDVFLSDFGKIKNNYREVLLINRIDWEDEKHTEDLILNADVVMKSPGIPDKAPIVKKLKEKGIPVISEIEFASQFTDALTIGITGSNGKTTTTLLTYHLLKQGGLNVGLAGNIGKSFAWQVAENKHDVYVLELSSFQLDGIEKFKPHIAVLTNLSPDHLDRYNYDYNQYIAAKFRITMNQTEEDYLIVDGDDVETQKWLDQHPIKAKLISFSLTKKIENGGSIEDNNLNNNINNDLFTMPINELSLEGKHNVKNAMAATAVAQLMKIRKQTIRESLSNFQGAEHRLEKVLKIQGVQYTNDSKATNVNATFFALDSMATPTVWIVGGVDKGNDYDELMPLVREKVKGIICLGVDNQKIFNAFSGVVDVMIETTSMTEAVKIAQRMAEKGDTVLLSPACASFDLFENYEDRGRQFKQAVHNL